MDKDTNTQSNNLIFTVMPRMDGKTVAPKAKPKESGTNQAPPPPTPLVVPQAPVAPVVQPIVKSQNQSTPVKSNVAVKSLLQVLTVVVAAGAFAASGYFGWNWWKSREANQSAAVPPPLESAVVPPPSEVIDTPPPSENVEVPVNPNAEWVVKYFGSLSCDTGVCADEADPDNDGLNNQKERQEATDPNNPDSDGDGLADGDEISIFGGSPLNANTAGNSNYTDADDAKGGYWSAQGGAKLDDAALLVIGQRIRQYGLHNPTLVTLVGFLEKYGAGTEQGDPSGIDMSAESKLERDMQRVNTIKKIGIALYKYQQSIGTFPEASDFADMLTKIKPYNLVATSYEDPINVEPYLYKYTVDADFKNFSLSYYSETQNQIIKYGLTQASRDASTEQTTSSDEKVIIDLENIRQALLIYAAAKSAGGEKATFPLKSELESALVPSYLQALPIDAKSGKVYEYETSSDRGSFIVSGELNNPPSGTTRYVCDPSGCLSD